MKNKRKISAVAALGVAASLLAAGVASADVVGPGPGNIDPGAKGSITLHKFSGAPLSQTDYPSNGKPITGDPFTANGNKPLEGVKFTLYKVGDLDVTKPGDWTDITQLNKDVLSAVSTGPASGASERAQTAITGSGYTLGTGVEKTTAADGKITWGQNESGASELALGVYLIAETGAPANVSEHTLPFLVTVPLAHNTDNTWIYNVNVYPKNALVDLQKEAVDAGTVGVGSEISWKVLNTVPTVQRDFDDYKLRDVLDTRLTYADASTTLTLGSTALTAGATGDYTLDVTPKTTLDTAQTLTITFTEAGLKKLDGAQGKELVWDFKTSVNTIGDGTIENKASVMVNKPSGNWTTDGVPSKEVSSNWGAIQIVKTEKNASGKALSGAVFQVFGTELEANTCAAAVANANGTLEAGCGVSAISVTRDVNGNTIAAQDKFTTGTDGKVVIPGLHVGINENGIAPETARGYWLVEIVPPAGFINDNTVYPVTVTAGTVTDAKTQLVFNAQEPPTAMPPTGAKEAKILSIGALLLTVGAVALVATRRKAESNQ